jgi:hypothetical protein
MTFCILILTVIFLFPQIKWDNRYLNCHAGQICYITVDGTDFKVNEPFPFNPAYYSHKLKHAGLRYEIAICIQTGWIVWINGPFPCGAWPDIRIARSSLHDELDDGEMYIADSGYEEGNQHCFTPNGINNLEQRMMGLARARHETVNGKFKLFRALSDEWRHTLEKHSLALRAAAVVTQIYLAKGQYSFAVPWDERQFTVDTPYHF